MRDDDKPQTVETDVMALGRSKLSRLTPEQRRMAEAYTTSPHFAKDRRYVFSTTAADKSLRARYRDLLHSAIDLGVVSAAAKYDPARSGFRTWAIKCMRYSLLHTIREVVRRRVNEPSWPHRKAPSGDRVPIDLVDPGSLAPRPYAVDAVEIIELARDSVSRQDWAVVEMRYTKGMTLDEIAAHYGVTKELIRIRLRVILADLLAFLRRGTPPRPRNYAPGQGIRPANQRFHRDAEASKPETGGDV